jgi:multidrug resistance efflux pump
MTNQLAERFTTIYDTVAAIQQSRSEYQLRHFVLAQHDTPEMQFYQCCIELRSVEFALANAKLQQERLELEVERLRSTGDAVDAVDAKIKQLELDNHAIELDGLKREAVILRRLFAEMPHFSRDEIERAQPEYWRARLNRQAVLQRAGGQVGIGWAQLDAMRQAGTLGTLEELLSGRGLAELVAGQDSGAPRDG